MWKQNDNSLVERKELHRLILMAKEYGIRDEVIGPSSAEGKIVEFLHQTYYENNGIAPSNIASFIYRSYPNWSNKGMFLLIETSKPNEDQKKNYSFLKAADLRERVGEICLYRFLVYNAKLEGKIISSYRMSEIITKLSTFDQYRFQLANELEQVPCLFIREVDTQEKPRDTNDCVSLLDAALFNRVQKGKPTIISLTVLAEQFVSPGIFGKAFSSIIQCIDKNKIFKIRLK